LVEEVFKLVVLSRTFKFDVLSVKKLSKIEDVKEINI